jgi:hypothetical protein
VRRQERRPRPPRRTHRAGADKLEAARRTHREGIRTFLLDGLSTTDQIVLADIRTRFELTASDDRC